MTPKDGADTRKRLLLAAVAVFADKGYKAATVREICRRAEGANNNAVTYYFGGKAKLYGLILDIMFAEIERRMAETAPDAAHDPPETRLRAFLHAYCATLYASGEVGEQFLRIFAREMLAPSFDVAAMTEKYIRPQTKWGMNLLSELLGPDVPREAVRDTLAGIVGQAAYYSFVWPVFKLAHPDHPGMAA
ncbi:MAG: CerR family C-terminal domain-containing protein, partial [Desulfovibrio sp.]|nr:CerR family C-terminal domain-containing protein [Desulfovibrio sp.]